MTRRTPDDDAALPLPDTSHVGEIRVSISPLKITGETTSSKNRARKPTTLSSGKVHEKSKKIGMHTVRSVDLIGWMSNTHSTTKRSGDPIDYKPVPSYLEGRVTGSPIVHLIIKYRPLGIAKYRRNELH
jgi:hypothetical protein